MISSCRLDRIDPEGGYLRDYFKNSEWLPQESGVICAPLEPRRPRRLYGGGQASAHLGNASRSPGWMR